MADVWTFQLTVVVSFPSEIDAGDADSEAVIRLLQGLGLLGSVVIPHAGPDRPAAIAATRTVVATTTLSAFCVLSNPDLIRDIGPLQSTWERRGRIGPC